MSYRARPAGGAAAGAVAASPARAAKAARTRDEARNTEAMSFLQGLVRDWLSPVAGSGAHVRGGIALLAPGLDPLALGLRLRRLLLPRRQHVLDPPVVVAPVLLVV